MTWEAVAVIVVTVAVFATLVAAFSLLFWKRLTHLDREMRGDVRLSRKDRQALAVNDPPDLWWVK
jgi:predicted dinucleotide-binding enzyme